MNRIARILFSLILTLAVAWAYFDGRYRRVAEWSGVVEQGFTRVVETRLGSVPEGRWVAFLGDSTMVPHPVWGGNSYPITLGHRLAADDVGTSHIAIPGLDPFQFYFLLGPLLDRQPEALVIVATMSMVLNGPGKGLERNYFCQFLEPMLIPNAMTLPFYARGMTIPHLLFCPFLRVPAVRSSSYILVGARLLFLEAPFWGSLERPVPEPGPDSRREQIRLSLEQAYAPSVTESTPAVVMLEAVVETASKHGVPTLVVISALPVEQLTKHGLYDGELFDRRVAVLREVIERAGGTVVDIHDQIPADEMRDVAGHLNAAGIDHVSDLVEPKLRELLGLGE
jgi:hypothetical protein